MNSRGRRRPTIGFKTLMALEDLWHEVFYLAGQGAERERLIAFERYLGKWLTDHPELQHPGAMGPATALHATGINALSALVSAILANSN